jgi:ubiquitin-protein ligase
MTSLVPTNDSDNEKADASSDNNNESDAANSDDANSSSSSSSDSDDSEYSYHSDEGDSDEQGEQEHPPYTLYTDTASLQHLRDTMVQQVQDILACSHDVALNYLESNKFSTSSGEKMLQFLDIRSSEKHQGNTAAASNGCAVCGCGRTETPATPPETTPLDIPARVKRKGRKKGVVAVNKELKHLIKSKAIARQLTDTTTTPSPPPWYLTFAPTHPSDSMVFTQRPQPNTLWYVGNHPGYRFSINCGSEYPQQAPAVVCLDAQIVFHPNVDPSNGHVCLNRLLADWSPTTQLYDVLLRIDSLFHQEQAGWGSSLNSAASQLYAADKSQFQQKVKQLIGGSGRGGNGNGGGGGGGGGGGETKITATEKPNNEDEEDKDTKEHELLCLHEQCGHALCVHCWSDYLQEQIRQFGVNALHSVCPVANCNVVLPDSILSRFGGDMYVAHAIDTHFVNQCVASSVLVRCPQPRCNLVCSALSSAQIIDCACGHHYCFGCSHPPHAPASCENMNSWKARQTSEDATALFMRSFIKPCPNCKEPWSKPNGCNHVKCTKCNTDFCFTCGQVHSFGGASGTFYKCNRYEETKKMNASKGLKTASTQARDDLKLFSHCIEGFQNAMDLVKETPLLVQTAIKDLYKETSGGGSSSSSGGGSMGSRLEMRLHECVESLSNARRMLAHSYIVFYAHKREQSTFNGTLVGYDQWSIPATRLFEDFQENLEAECEEISITLTTLTTKYTHKEKEEQRTQNKKQQATGSSSSSSFVEHCDPDDDFSDMAIGEYATEKTSSVEATSILLNLARSRKKVTSSSMGEFVATMTQRCHVLDQRSQKLQDVCVEGMGAGHEDAMVMTGEETKTAAAAAAKKQNQKMMPSFLWCEGNDNWTPYNDEINEKLERRYQKITTNTNNGRLHVNIISAGRKYQIYLGPNRMSQMNVGTKGTRKVMRIVAKKIDLEWTCRLCTYHNTGGKVTCYQCESARSKE